MNKAQEPHMARIKTPNTKHNNIALLEYCYDFLRNYSDIDNLIIDNHFNKLLNKKQQKQYPAKHYRPHQISEGFVCLSVVLTLSDTAYSPTFLTESRGELD